MAFNTALHFLGLSGVALKKHVLIKNESVRDTLAHPNIVLAFLQDSELHLLIDVAWKDMQYINF